MYVRMYINTYVPTINLYVRPHTAEMNALLRFDTLNTGCLLQSPTRPALLNDLIKTIMLPVGEMNIDILGNVFVQLRDLKELKRTRHFVRQNLRLEGAEENSCPMSG